MLEKTSRLSWLTTAHSAICRNKTMYCTNTWEGIEKVLKDFGQEDPHRCLSRITFLYCNHPKLEKISPFYFSNETSTNHPESGALLWGCKVLVSTIPGQTWPQRLHFRCPSGDESVIKIATANERIHLGRREHHKGDSFDHGRDLLLLTRGSKLWVFL